LVQEEKEAREAEEEAKREAKEAEEAAKAEAAASEPSTSTGETTEKAAEEEDDARMTKEQLNELAEALNILTAKSSIVKERRELQSLLEDNMLSEAVSCCSHRLQPQLTYRNRRNDPMRLIQRLSPSRSELDR